MNLELDQLHLKYRDLRVLDPGRVSRLVAAMARDDQRAPVLVVGAPDAQDRRVLVDGYHRVAALRTLGRDLVRALSIDLPEAEALVLAWRLETGRRKSTLEEAWLLRELVANHERTQAALAAELRRAPSWVSQRLGLLRALPADVQEALRTAKIPAQAAMKSLVPLARLDPAATTRLVAAAPAGLTVRQWARIAASWRSADALGRRRIEENPALLLRAEEVLASVPLDAQERLARDLEALAGLAGRARRRVKDGDFARANEGPAQTAWSQAQAAFAALQREVLRAGS